MIKDFRFAVAGLVRVVDERSNRTCKIPADTRCAFSQQGEVVAGRGGYQNVAQWDDKDDQAIAASNGGREGDERRSGTLRAEMPFCIVGRNGFSVVETAQNTF